MKRTQAMSDKEALQAQLQIACQKVCVWRELQRILREEVTPAMMSAVRNRGRAAFAIEDVSGFLAEREAHEFGNMVRLRQEMGLPRLPESWPVLKRVSLQ
jgi:hypothetical protein